MAQLLLPDCYLPMKSPLFLSECRQGTAPPQLTGNFSIGFAGSSNTTSCACSLCCVTSRKDIRFYLDKGGS